jgi:cytochrome c-type biogenesis protein CcmH/NrfG
MSERLYHEQLIAERGAMSERLHHKQLIDSSAVAEDAVDMREGAGRLYRRVLLALSILSVPISAAGLVGAYGLYAQQTNVSGVTADGLVYRAAVYRDGKRPPIPRAISEEMDYMRRGGEQR